MLSMWLMSMLRQQPRLLLVDLFLPRLNNFRDVLDSLPKTVIELSLTFSVDLEWDARDALEAGPVYPSELTSLIESGGMSSLKALRTLRLYLEVGPSSQIRSDIYFWRLVEDSLLRDRCTAAGIDLVVDSADDLT